jgi:4'-phosphopantetheinyl transferase
MADVYWLEQTDADVPAEDDWLSSKELLRLGGMRVPKRRVEWRLGRWTAKHAVAAYLEIYSDPQGLATIEIWPAASGAPEVFLANKRAAVTISLSHRDGIAACAVAPPAAALGCDLEVIEPRSDAFVADYFTSQEQALVAQASAADRPRLLALLWSGKESALKALGVGLRLDTRCVIVSAAGPIPSRDENGDLDDPSLALRTDHADSWHPLRVNYSNGRLFHGWWQHTGTFLKTLVADPPPAPPIPLHVTE